MPFTYLDALLDGSRHLEFAFLDRRRDFDDGMFLLRWRLQR